MPYDLFYQSGKIFRSPSNTMSHCHAGRRFHKENELTSSHRNLHCPQLSNDGPVSLFFTKTMSILPHSEGISYLEYFTPKSFFLKKEIELLVQENFRKLPNVETVHHIHLPQAPQKSLRTLPLGTYYI